MLRGRSLLGNRCAAGLFAIRLCPGLGFFRLRFALRALVFVFSGLFLSGLVLEIGFVPAGSLEFEAGGRDQFAQGVPPAFRAGLHRWLGQFLNLLQPRLAGLALVFVDRHFSSFRSIWKGKNRIDAG